jgi:molybdopterin-guanine dinucleotide biosynthesis protein
MSHHPIEPDTTNKDCQRYRTLGVEVLATNSIDEAKLFLQAMVAKHKICLVEGGRRLNLPSVILQREGFYDSNWIQPKNIVLSLELKL